MSSLIIWEANYLLLCFVYGVILAFVYDILRIFRIIIPHGSLMTAAEDIIYWTGAAIGMFLVLYEGDNGTIRWFAIGASAVAVVLVNICVSRFTVPLIGGLLAKPIRFLTKVLKKIYVKYIKKQLKSLQKKGKMIKTKSHAKASAVKRCVNGSRKKKKEDKKHKPE